MFDYLKQTEKKYMNTCILEDVPVEKLHRTFKYAKTGKDYYRLLPNGKAYINRVIYLYKDAGHENNRALNKLLRSRIPHVTGMMQRFSGEF